ncbi:MAG: DUF5683 domain-containing protein [Chitinophagales bacterium]|nr:DUF5683 domain-containing protein [Chitinophagales bacterium]
MKKVVLFVCSLLFAVNIFAQADTSVVADTALVITNDTIESIKKENWFNRGYPNPKRALVMGLVVPGSGQIYNKSWWKVPIVYGAIVGMGFTIDYNQSRYRRLRKALNLKRAGEEHEWSNTQLDNEQSLRSLRDEYDKNTQIAYVGMFLVYTLQAMEAFVDAHLKNFDVDDDIGAIKLRPEAGYIPQLGTATVGIGISIPIQSKPLLQADDAPSLFDTK